MITIYSEADFIGIKEAGILAARALEYVCSFVKIGVSTQYLDDKFVEFLNNNVGIAACNGYCGYPKNLCVSINEEICHGIPGPRLISENDIVSVDLVVELNGYYGDTCKTIALGKQSRRINLLMDITQKSMMQAINAVKPGMFFKDIGKIIEDFVKPYRFGIVKQYCGHGIGNSLHHEPQVLHYFKASDPEIEIKQGMCFTIEPMICEKKGDSKELDDGWTVVSKDKSICVQFEHTIFVKERETIITTKI